MVLFENAWAAKDKRMSIFAVVSFVFRPREHHRYGFRYMS